MAPANLYDKDDLYDADDYEEEAEDGLSAEDKAAMERGTAEVKKCLGGNAGKVTVEQIQEALWHYYYDVDKSVAYLSKTIIAPPPAATSKKVSEGKSNGFFFSPALGLFARLDGADTGFTFSTDPRQPPPGQAFRFGQSLASSKLDFGDMPWLNTPPDRHARLIPPVQPAGGLLGGAEEAPRKSKLQALAAARKKKNDEKKEQQETKNLPVEGGIKRLSIPEDAQKDHSKSSSTYPSKKLRSNEESVPAYAILNNLTPRNESSSLPPDKEHSKNSATREHRSARLPDVPHGHGGKADAPRVPPGEISNGKPSAFAKTLVGSAPDNRQANRPDFYAMPYASSSTFSAHAFSEPSPDDVVLAAQAKAGKKSAPAAKAAALTSKKVSKGNATSLDTGLVNRVSSLKVSDVPPPKGKGLDVIKEHENSKSKKSINFVVVGHVDAGKSTLMGRLLLELKYVQERTVDKYRRQAERSGKQSFALAWVMDQRTEERERGVTIDIATNHFETPNTKFTILDAPGHRDFVPNMIAGASQADIAVLVIDANTGAYEKGLKGQTREHVLLLRSLGVQRLIVAVNKLDMVGWSQERFDEISQQIMGFLTGLGFQSKLVSFLPISGLNGDNIASKTEDKAASWYTGSTLIEALEESEPSRARALSKPFRMSISEVFRSQQQGTTTLAGRIDAGNIQIGDAVVVQPSGEQAHIKSIMADADFQEWAVAGQSVSIALTDIDPVHIRVGDMVCSAADPISVGDTFSMRAMAFEHLMLMPIDLHRGRLHAAGQIQSIPATLDKVSGQVVKKKPKVVQPGGVARVMVNLASKIPLEKGQRVVLRSGGVTIAAGLLE